MRCVPVLVILVVAGCAGGLIGSKEKKLAEQELTQSVDYLVLEHRGSIARSRSAKGHVLSEDRWPDRDPSATKDVRLRADGLQRYLSDIGSLGTGRGWKFLVLPSG